MKIKIIIVLVALSSSIFGQKPWTIDECVNYALEHSLQLERKGLESQEARYTYIGRMANATPRVYANGSYSVNSGRSINSDNYQYVNQTYNSSNAGLNLDWQIFAGFQQYYSIASAKCLSKSAQYEYEVMRNALNLQVEEVFLQTLQYAELHEAANQRIIGVKLLEEQASQSTRIGKSSKGDYLLIAAQLAKEKEQYSTSQNQLMFSKQQLLYLMNADTLKDIMLEKPQNMYDNYIISSSADSIYSIALMQLPQIKSHEYLLKSSIYTLNQQRSLFSPSVSISAGYNSWYSELSQNPRGTGVPYSYLKQMSDKAGSQISVNVYIPIFNRFQTKININRSKIYKKEVETDLELSKRNLYNEVQKAWLDARSAFEKMNAKEATASSFEEAYRYIEDKFKLGMASATDLIVAQSNYSSSASDLVQARYNYIIKLKVLEFYEGKNN